jgi:hypothetical protein
VAGDEQGTCLEGLFDGRHFDREIIILCVRRFLRHKLSLRGLVEIIAERQLIASFSRPSNLSASRARTGFLIGDDRLVRVQISGRSERPETHAGKGAVTLTGCSRNMMR